MNGSTGTFEDEVRRLLVDYDARSLDRIDDWDGKTLEGLQPFLTEDEYEMLVDHLRPVQDDDE